MTKEPIGKRIRDAVAHWREVAYYKSSVKPHRIYVGQKEYKEVKKAIELNEAGFTTSETGHSYFWEGIPIYPTAPNKAIKIFVWRNP